MSQGNRVGIVGVGRMGMNMALRLHETGRIVKAVYDIDRTRAQALADQVGATAVPSLSDVSEMSDVVLTVVTDDAAMDTIYSERNDSLLAHASGRLFINCATVTPDVHRTVEKRVEQSGGLSLEACMASSITQARTGTLYLMCAGRPEAYERAMPILQALSNAMRYLGPAGTAAEVKALVNMVMNVNTAALAEGLGLGRALGLDLTVLREVFAQTGAASRVLETDGEDMQDREHDCYFSAAHAAKDSGIALKLAHERGLPLPLAEATKAQYDTLVRLGKGELDKSAIAELTFPERREELVEEE